MASTVHQTRDQERNSPSRRAGSLPARSLALVLHWLEGPMHSPFIESFLLRQMPSCFSAGSRIYTGLSCPVWALVLYLSFPSVLEVFSLPGQGIPDEPPNVMRNVWIPEREKRRLPRQCNSQKKGSLLMTRVRAPAVHPTQWYGVREPKKHILKNWGIIYCPYLSLAVAFVLKSILSDIIVTPDFLTFPFAWNMSSHPFFFNHIFRPEVSLL